MEFALVKDEGTNKLRTIIHFGKNYKFQMNLTKKNEIDNSGKMHVNTCVFIYYKSHNKNLYSGFRGVVLTKMI